MELSIPPSPPAFSTFLFNLTDIVNARPAIGQGQEAEGWHRFCWLICSLAVQSKYCKKCTCWTRARKQGQCRYLRTNGSTRLSLACFLNKNPTSWMQVWLCLLTPSSVRGVLLKEQWARAPGPSFIRVSSGKWAPGAAGQRNETWSQIYGCLLPLLICSVTTPHIF